MTMVTLLMRVTVTMANMLTFQPVIYNISPHQCLYI